MEPSSSPPYVDTPYGILTEGGRWYHVTEEEVQEYAGAVLDHVPLEQLLQWADTWVDSARTIVLWSLPLLLWGLPTGWALAGALGLFVGWALLSPSLPSLLAVRAVSILEHVLAQGLFYVLTMSAFAGAERYTAVGVGLVGFVLLRWGVLEWAAGYAIRPLRRVLYPLPVADQVLRGLIVRVALKYRLSVPQVDDITKDILDNLHGHEGANDDASPRDRSGDR
jgi:hypothetical protein